MKPSVYLETTIIGYMTMRKSELLQIAANQFATKEWWTQRSPYCELFVSELFVQECSSGDPVAARERLEFLDGIPLLEVDEDSSSLASDLLFTVPLPKKAEYDALHIAVAAVHGIEYLLTWNLRHIANATLRSKIEMVCRDHGLEPPIICTPAEFWEPRDDA